MKMHMSVDGLALCGTTSQFRKIKLVSREEFSWRYRQPLGQPYLCAKCVRLYRAELIANSVEREVVD